MLESDPKRTLLTVLVGALVVLLFVHYAGRLVVPWTLVLVVLGLAGAIIYVWVVALRGIFLDRWGPVRTARGIVTRKYTREYDVDLPPSDPGSGTSETVYEDWNFWVAFDVGTAELEFRAPRSLYRELEEGAPVALTYRGEKLISAVPMAPPKQAGAPPEALAPPPPPQVKPPPPDSRDLRPLG